MPYKDSVATATGTNDLFLLKYNNAEAKRMFRLENLNAANPGSTISALQQGTGLAGFFSVNNPTAGGTALEGITNSNVGGALAPVGVYGESSGTGSVGGAFWNTNPANTYPALYSRTLGTGHASYFEIVNAANSAAALRVETNGTGNAIQTAGKIQAGQFIGDGSGLTNVVSSPVLFPYSNTTTASASTMFDIANTGTGKAGRFTINNASNAENALYVSTNGTGENAIFEVTSGTGAGSAIVSLSNSQGVTTFSQNTNPTSGTAGFFEVFSPTNTSRALIGRTNGTGNAGYFYSSSISNNAASLFAESESNNGGAAVVGHAKGTQASGGAFRNLNASNPFSALYGSTVGTGSAIFGEQLHATSGSAGYFKNSTASNTYPALTSETFGSGAAIFGTTASGYAAIHGQQNSSSPGHAGLFEITDANNTYEAAKATTVGTGAAGLFVNSNTTASGAVGVNAEIFSNAGGTAIRGYSQGTAGHGGQFEITNANNNFPALLSVTNGTGPAIQGESSNSTHAVVGKQLNSSGIKNAIFGLHDGSGLGHAGLFINNNAANSYPALQAEVYGTGAAFQVSHNGASGNIALFSNNYVAAARIDKTGKGFFNGGTQPSGADVAELFDVEGTKSEYEPGDVLVISESTDRTVEKSNSPNSTKVAGVYATKPGVTLTEKDMNESTDALVPMGVIGVIPTKVCLENGPIKRGDLLVTSSVRGKAMKAIAPHGDGMFPAGVILGKALENYDGSGNGLIKVLVNVK
jgi:hypothetical protein